MESAKKQRGSTLSEVVVQSAVAQSVPSAVEMAAGPELRGEEQDCVVPALVGAGASSIQEEEARVDCGGCVRFCSVGPTRRAGKRRGGEGYHGRM